MKRYLLPGLALFFIVFWGCVPQKQVSKGSGEELTKSILWEIRGSGLKSPSFLLGTIHLIPEDLYFWTPEMDHALKSAEQIAMELDMNEMDPMSLMGMMGSLMLPDGKGIRDFVNQDQYDIIKDYFEEFGLPFMLLEKLKPYFLYLFISLDINNLQQESIKSYETEILDKAAAAQIPTLGLETIEFQISLFDSIPYSYQTDMLLKAIEEQARPEIKKDKDMESLFQAYVDQDIEALFRESNDEEDEIMKKFSSLLIDKRNKKWIPVIEKLIWEKPTLIAVGAGHLGGPNGVIRLLQKQGYSLIPVKMNIHGTD